MSYTTSGLVETVLNNQAAIDPTGTDDSSQGYSIESRWVNTSSGAEFVCVDASVGSAVWKETTFLVAGSGQLLWEWNGSDATQFDSPVLLSSANPTGWVPGAATVGTGSVSAQPGGSRLALPSSGNGVTGTHWGVYRINDLTLPGGSFKLIINSDFASVSTSNAGYGVFFWGDLTPSSTPYGYLWAPQGGRIARADGTSGTTVNGSIGTMTTSASSQMEYRFEARIDDPATPHGQFSAIIQSGTNLQSRVSRNNYNSSDGDLGMPSLPAWGGNASMNQLGLCIFSTGGGGGATTWYINSIKVETI